ncbi:ADL098Cp [Eremothecium gossypii ATCC 10895]|uniref:ADL098Cp n=1 Tax=Eremothecium gossypii (strain ATCC 10895 / CBS 109.51 / FGSC 9923 / NRRL Y-1056) TaxID=284811 RepID=Q75AM1_EREGS|nr:ADL098Cp [Eremothecium gossypii ATCC 10895]AAS51822.1 ADL098Cp [Eremothecium gossypii ATCC 10895]
MTRLRTRAAKSGVRVDYREQDQNFLYEVEASSSDEVDIIKDATATWLEDEKVELDITLDSDAEGDAELDAELDMNRRRAEKSAAAASEDAQDTEKDLDAYAVQERVDRLQEFVRQSKVYSGIIADTLLHRAQERQSEQASSAAAPGPARKKPKTVVEFFKRSKQQPADEKQPEPSIQQPTLVRNCTLKPYQVEGVNWLITLYENGLNGILADEMGLGKTIQSIALLAFIYEMDTRGPFLVTAPLSVVDNWITEFEKFAPSIPVLKYYSADGPGKRHAILKEFFRKNSGEGVVVTSYEIVMRDMNVILSHQWKFLIVDEGHRLKNINCKLIRELKRINTFNRLLLTGTPLQNNLAELWSLLNFILPDVFADFEIFSKWFDFSDLDLKTSSQRWDKIIGEELEKNLVTNLHTILKPFLLRRLKRVVLADALPPKREYIINCPLTPLQTRFYKMALAGKLKRTVFTQAIKEFFTLNREHIGSVSNKTIREFIDYKTSDEEIQASKVITDMEKLYEQHIHKELRNKRLQNLMMQLRQIVDSTFLFYFPYLKAEDLQLPVLLQTSGKLQILQQLLPRLLAAKHKVLIFSQFVSMLDLIEDWCELNNYSACRIDGSMDNETRREQINSFSEKGSPHSLFLLSTRAGGLGINLTAADSVILFDNDWNPQVDLQAMDRSHRIGQQHPVIVYRLYCDKTVESVILARATNKRKLEQLVIQMGKFSTLKKLALNEHSFLTLGTQTASNNNARELVQELSKLLLDSESTFSFSSAGPLTDEELEVLTDRSIQAYKITDTEYPHIKLFETSSGFDN